MKSKSLFQIFKGIKSNIIKRFCFSYLQELVLAIKYLRELVLAIATE